MAIVGVTTMSVFVAWGMSLWAQGDDCVDEVVDDCFLRPCLNDGYLKNMIMLLLEENTKTFVHDIKIQKGPFPKHLEKYPLLGRGGARGVVPNILKADSLVQNIWGNKPSIFVQTQHYHFFQIPIIQ